MVKLATNTTQESTEKSEIPQTVYLAGIFVMPGTGLEPVTRGFSDRWEQNPV